MKSAAQALPTAADTEPESYAQAPNAGPARTDAERARAEEARARQLLEQNRAAEAEELLSDLVRTLETGGDGSPLYRLLTLRGVALARLNQTEASRDSFLRAAAAARRAGDPAAEAEAALTLAEELSASLPLHESAESFERAASLLGPTPPAEVQRRLLDCARRLVSLAAVEVRQPRDWRGFSFKRAVHAFEAGVISRALADAGGSVSRASRLLGFRHHNSLASILNNRHRELLGVRSPVKPRRRSIITVREPARAPRFAGAGTERVPVALHVGDDPAASEAVRAALEAEGWRVETCPDGEDALARLRRPANYDLVLLDYDLPGGAGVEVARETRSLPHRRETPIIMLSAAERGLESHADGVNIFVRKPHDPAALADAVRRLLPEKAVGSSQ